MFGLRDVPTAQLRSTSRSASFFAFVTAAPTPGVDLIAIEDSYVLGWMKSFEITIWLASVWTLARVEKYRKTLGKHEQLSRSTFSTEQYMLAKYFHPSIVLYTLLHSSSFGGVVCFMAFMCLCRDSPHTSSVKLSRLARHDLDLDRSSASHAKPLKLVKCSLHASHYWCCVSRV